MLNLSGAENITDVGLQSLSGCTSSLQYLNFDNAYRITGAGLAAITKTCIKLQQLSLSGCMGIDGAGFGILGQNCRELVSLKLSGCRQIRPWAFMKIFESCKRLQSVDISFCALVTDQEMKVLADSASDLRQLNLRDCKLISDVGLSYLSLGCPKLSEINLRRSEMPFRITDVALLQLGQAYTSLVAINLHGCEMISDTGLSWLAGWSKELRHLDLSNCNKVTNCGIRHIGEGKSLRPYLLDDIREKPRRYFTKTLLTLLGCQNLRSIVLSNLKRVSDIGVRCLATGCNHIEALNGKDESIRLFTLDERDKWSHVLNHLHLQGSGMSMLSDGVHRSFGLEGLQALGQSNSSATMKHLNLHGCSLLSTHTMKAIGKLSNLETLDLSGWDKLTLEGAHCIGKACTRISSLSFANCGDCVNDAIVEAAVIHLEYLSSANLSFCPKVSDRSLKALSTCVRLESLDLTGCVSVTDQSILQLCEGHFSPGLRHLFLAQCCKIGDTTLSWITEGFKQTLDGHVSLETLSLKGTKVTPTAVKGIRDRFPYSLLKSNDSFLGFFPISRTNDHKVVNHYHKRFCSAAVIQARVRARREKDTLKRARGEYAKRRVAILIGALHRGRKARMHYRELKRAKKKRMASALRLQCAFRCRLSRKKKLRLRERRWLTIAPLASCIIQKQWRGMLGRRKAEQKREEKCRQYQRQVEAAICIQAWCRMLQAKRIKLLLLCRWFTGELNRHRAAIQVQCAWRMAQSVILMQRLREEFLKQQQLERSSASRIAGAYRTILFIKVVKRRVERTSSHLKARGIL